MLPYLLCSKLVGWLEFSICINHSMRLGADSQLTVRSGVELEKSYRPTTHKQKSMLGNAPFLHQIKGLGKSLPHPSVDRKY